MAGAITTPEMLPLRSTLPVTVSREEYLRSIYHPDCDFVDGHVKERKWGEFEHSMPQKVLLPLFGRNEGNWNVMILPECRLGLSRALPRP